MVFSGVWEPNSKVLIVQLCTFIPNSAYGDLTSVAWNWPWQSYLQHGNGLTLKSGFLPQNLLNYQHTSAETTIITVKSIYLRKLWADPKAPISRVHRGGQDKKERQYAGKLCQILFDQDQPHKEKKLRGTKMWLPNTLPHVMWITSNKSPAGLGPEASLHEVFPLPLCGSMGFPIRWRSCKNRKHLF